MPFLDPRRSIASHLLWTCCMLGLVACGDLDEGSSQRAEPVELASTASALTASIAVLEDTAVRGGLLADQNFGDSTQLAVNAAKSDVEQRSFLKFDLRNLTGSVQSATLRLFGGAPGPATIVRAHAVGSSWGERTLTFRNAPLIAEPPLSGRLIGSRDWQSWNVTGHVQANLGGTVSFALIRSVQPGLPNPITLFNAREMRSNTPQLVVATRDAAAPAKMTIGANFWRHTWGNGTGDYFKSGVDWASVSDPWAPQLIADLAYARVLRFMDWGPVNGSKLVNWSERVPKTADQYNYQVSLTGPDGSSHGGEGVAYEWQIDLANRAGSDLWINVPHAASDDFVTQLARLIQAQLRSDRKVYVEYSNEVWNQGFYQHRYAAERAAASSLPASVSYQNRSVSLEPWLSYSTYRALQIFDRFQEVFGVNSPRLVKVLAGQLGYNNWPDFVNAWGDLHPLVNQHMAALRSPAHNPKAIKVDAYALAPYWSGSTLEQMRSSLDDLTERMREAQRALDLEGSQIRLICYEGGQDGGNQVGNARDPGIYQLTMDAYARLAPLVKGPFVVYTHVGWDGTYAWGLKQTSGSSRAESHKFRATLDWVRVNP